MLILHFRGAAPYQQLSLIQLSVPATPLIYDLLDSLPGRLLGAHKHTSASSTAALMCTISSLLAASAPPQLMWRRNLVYESGGRKEMEADPEKDKHRLI